MMLSQLFTIKLWSSPRIGPFAVSIRCICANDVDYSSTSCHVILYADDILLTASSVPELEKLLLHKCENELH